MVSSTPSGGWLHSSPVIPELGFCLGTRAQMFWLEEGHPAALGARQAAAHHAVADHGAARRRAVSRLGLARRRRPGSVDHAIFHAPRPCRHEHAGVDRRAGLAFRAFPELVLAAHGAPRRAGASKAACRKRPSPNWNAAATTSRSARTGRKAGSPPPRATAAAAAPPPMRAACRATRRGGDIPSFPRKREAITTAAAIRAGVMGPRLRGDDGSLCRP